MATPVKIVDQNLPTVALVGRVNVGKSTLFNRIVERPAALVSSIAGTTRTRNIAVATWRGKQFRLIDTGGLTFTDAVPLEADIIRQTELALAEADLVVLVGDSQTGILPQERDLARRLRARQARLPVIAVANKVDRPAMLAEGLPREWLALGLGEPWPVSAVTGRGVGDLLDAIFRVLARGARRPKQIKEPEALAVAIIGRPNVGKSSLFNKLIGEERVVVNPMPHTTREPHDTLVTVDGRAILFIDTAGIRRKTKVSGELERAGISKSVVAMKRAEIVLLVLDTSEPLTDQDQQLGKLVSEHGKSVIIVLNKWDLAADNSDSFRHKVEADVYAAFPHLKFAPVVFVSARTHYRVHQIFPLLEQAQAGRRVELTDIQLKDFLQRVTRRHLPTRGRGVRHPKLLGFQQLATNPPVLELLIKSGTSVHMSYVHYLENRLREEFGFFASPIIMKLSKLKRI